MNKKEMSMAKLLAVTIFPSAMATALYVGVGLHWQSLPSMTLFFIVAVLSLFPFEIWVLLSANKKRFGRYGFQIAFLNSETIPVWKVLFYGFALFGFAGIMSVTVAPLENWLMNDLSAQLYALLPAYFDWDNFQLMKEYPKEIRIITSVLYIVLNVLILPVIEEIYFRGYLTNELKRYGVLAPLIVAVVFSFYHWWLPFNNIFRICIFGAAAVAAYKKKNICISIVFHCLCNLLSSVSFVVALLN